jgi:hypothetical protein
MDSLHHLPGVEAVGGGIEVRARNVLELNPTALPIPPLQEADFPRAQGTLPVVEDPNLPRSLHAAAPIRSW